MSAFSIRQDTSFIAYFSMEIGLEPGMPTYSGGLGVLAGDTLRAAAYLGVPMVAVTMLYRKGHFHQHLDAGGNQTESPSIWYPEQFLEPMPARISVTVEGRPVQVRAWRYDIRGAAGRQVPVFFLDTALRENGPFDQTLTDHLYGGDEHYRLCQETVLGLGGVAMLRALGYDRVRAYHMNEGHSALLTLALLSEQIQGRGLLEAADEDRNEVRKRCVFTTHTPVPAGHDQFPLDLVRRVLGDEKATALEAAHCYLDGKLNMTYLALFFSHYINGVAMRHGEISRGMFPHYPIDSITNGVHAVTWATKPFRELFDRHIPEWRRDNLYLRYALGIPLADIRQAHEHAKIGLFAEIAKRK
ncbi:MAG: alpha-glucan family phosphorylase, partial [Candidatus Methylomirabilis sp.]|nr:alpha-glucan family phosphorylase [Deltaproteobacteria bacterium]